MNRPPVRVARFEQLSARTFHDIVRLRVDAFVVEQGCPYPELDGRDTLETTQHLWIEEEGAPVAYLRIYPGDDGETWIGQLSRHRATGAGASVRA